MSKILDELKENELFNTFTAKLSKEEAEILNTDIAKIANAFEEVMEKLKALKPKSTDI